MYLLLCHQTLVFSVLVSDRRFTQVSRMLADRKEISSPCPCSGESSYSSRCYKL